MSKINQLVSQWPKGTVRTVSELKRLGYNSQLLKNYANSGWIEQYVNGIYKLKDDKVNWPGVLYGIQMRSNTTIHAGASAALELNGYAHYLKRNHVFLFGSTDENFGNWLRKLENVTLKRTNEFDYKNEKVISRYDAGGFEIKISSPELAILEMLYLVPVHQSFDEAYLIMEGLATLRPKLLQELLEECNSVKIKRLFLWMAHNQGHSWLKELDLSRIQVGKGKRVIVKGGLLDAKYNITVPRQYAE